LYRKVLYDTLNMYVTGNATGMCHFCEETGENIWKQACMGGRNVTA